MYFWKVPELRGDLRVLGMPKLIVWGSMSEMVSLPNLWVDSKIYQGNLDMFGLPKKSIGAIFCQ